MYIIYLIQHVGLACYWKYEEHHTLPCSNSASELQWIVLFLWLGVCEPTRGGGISIYKGRGGQSTPLEYFLLIYKHWQAEMKTGYRKHRRSGSGGISSKASWGWSAAQEVAVLTSNLLWHTNKVLFFRSTFSPCSSGRKRLIKEHQRCMFHLSPSTQCAVFVLIFVLFPQLLCVFPSLTFPPLPLFCSYIEFSLVSFAIIWPLYSGRVQSHSQAPDQSWSGSHLRLKSIPERKKWREIFLAFSLPFLFPPLTLSYLV